MKIFYIAYYTFIRGFRDIKSIANMMLLPIILILILGNALGGIFNITDIGKTNVAYVNNDKGELSQNFEEFVDNDDIKEIIGLKKVDNYNQGLELVNNEEAAAVIVIEEDYSSQLQSGKKADIKIYGDQNNELRSSIVKNIIDSYTSGSNAMYAKKVIGGDSQEFIMTDVVEDVSLSSEGKIPKAMDYYSVTMLVLIIMYGSLYSLHGISEDYLEKMKNRLLSTPVDITKHVIGKVSGTVLVVFIQSLVLILFTKYVYQSYWGNSPLEIIFITLTLSIFAVTMGITVAMLAKEKKIAIAIISILIPVMTFVAGGYTRIISDSPFYNAIKQILPSSLGQTAYFNAIYGEFSGQTISSISVIWAITIIMLVISVIAGRRRFN